MSSSRAVATFLGGRSALFLKVKKVYKSCHYCNLQMSKAPNETVGYKEWDTP